MIILILILYINKSHMILLKTGNNKISYRKSIGDLWWDFKYELIWH